jgi:hypothetical protein
MPPVGMKVEIDTRGFQGIVSEAKSRNVTLKGVRAGIKVLVGPAKGGAPRRSGALRQSQGYRAAKGRKGKTIAFAVQGARKAFEKTYKGRRTVPGFYDHLVQGGTRPHRLGKGEKLERFDARKTADVFKPGTSQTTGGVHPGAKPNPYRRRAYQSNKDQIGRAVLQTMGVELQKILAKAGKP